MADDALLARVERLESLHQIEQLAYRYASYADARDLEALLLLFVDDVNCGKLGVGRDALRASYDVVHRNFYRTIHHVTGQVIDLVDADHATARVTMRAEHEIGDKWVVAALCMFDTLERRDGTWYYVQRKPESWYSADVLERPAGPNWGSMRPPRLPQLFPSWAPFWEGRDEKVAELTRFP